jgi:hypothetical protein
VGKAEGECCSQKDCPQPGEVCWSQADEYRRSQEIVGADESKVGSEEEECLGRMALRAESEHTRKL